LLAEALAITHQTGECIHQAKLYRLKGLLTLQQSKIRGLKPTVPSAQHPAPRTRAEAEAEALLEELA
jgi:hypothetical protein